MPDPLGDLVVGARGIASHPEAADSRLVPVEHYPAPERDRATTKFAVGLVGITWWVQDRRVERI